MGLLTYTQHLSDALVASPPCTPCRLSAIEEDDKVVVLRHFVMTKESLASLPEVMHHRFILQVGVLLLLMCAGLLLV